MNDLTKLKDELVSLSHELGLEPRQLTILGEGNTSTRYDSESFLVKASGSSLSNLGQADLSQVYFQPILDLLTKSNLSEETIEQELNNALVDSSDKKPSVETFLHAICLSVGGASWVGHCHTVSINQILCSTHGAEPFKRHIFPDAIVVCGKNIASVPYADPGFELAKLVKTELETHKLSYGTAPKLLLMENHGPVALGQSAKEVLNIMLMADKWAKTLVGALQIGQPNYLPDSEVDKIDNRLDEHYRRKELVNS